VTGYSEINKHAKQAVPPVVGLTQYAPTYKWWLEPRAFRLKVTAHVGITVHVGNTKFEVRIGLLVSKISGFFVTALSGLVTLTFGLSTSKWGHDHELPSCQISGSQALPLST